MSRIELRLALPTGSWLGDASRACPDATYRVTETLAASDSDITAVAVSGTDRDRATATVRDHDRVTDVNLCERRGTATVFHVTGEPPSFVVAAREVGLPIDSTIEVANGGASMFVAGDGKRLTAFGERLTAAGVTVGVGNADRRESERPLTDAQRRLVLAAIEGGYYDTPRGCTLTELAESQAIAKSTCSETLHRAEGRILHRFVEGMAPFGNDVASSENGVGSREEHGKQSDPQRERDRRERESPSAA